MKLQVEFDREQLHSSIIGAMRTLGLSRVLAGYDLLRGSAFGKLDHPEYDDEVAIKRAIEMSKIPSVDYSYGEAISVMYYSIEDAIIEIDEDMTEEETVYNVIHRICEFVKYDFYRYKIRSFLDSCGFKERIIKTELINNMLFKRMIEEESSEECIINFGYKKTYQKQPESFEEARKTICDYLSKELANRSILEYLDMLADAVYNYTV